jgi:hypothetical protein
MKTKRDLPSDFDHEVIPAGTTVTLVELLDKAKGIWMSEARIVDESLVGGARYATLTVKKDDLED